MCFMAAGPGESSGTNYAVGVCDDNPHEAALMSEVALTVIVS
jgi:hypothetical protein